MLWIFVFQIPGCSGLWTSQNLNFLTSKLSKLLWTGQGAVGWASSWAKVCLFRLGPQKRIGNKLQVWCFACPWQARTGDLDWQTLAASIVINL